MRPYDARTTYQLLKMETDNFPREAEKWSILHNGQNVSLHAPNGDGYISIPVEDFNAIVDWYMADQPTTEQSDS